MEKKGFGLIGAGIWGETHAKTYASAREARFVAVCDINPDRAKEVAQQYGAEKFTTDYKELLKMDGIDAVSIATPDPYHTEIAVSAAEARKHILIEKPLATSVQDCLSIIRYAKDAGVKLMCDFHNRWNPAMVKIWNAVQKKELGQPLAGYLRLSDTWEVPVEWFSWSARTSVLWFLGSHGVDIIRWVFDSEVDTVYAVSRSVLLRSKGVDTPDFYHATLQLDNGASVQMENAWIIAKNTPIIFDFKFELLGTDGTCYADCSHHRMVERYTKEDCGFADVAVAPVVHGKPVGFGVESIRHFIDCVIDDREPLVTGIDGLRATEVLIAIEESCKTDGPVKVTHNIP